MFSYWVCGLAFFKMAVITSDGGQIIGLTKFGNTIYNFRIKVGNYALTIRHVILYEFWNCKMSATSKLRQLLDFLHIDGSITFFQFFNLYWSKYNTSIFHYSRNFWCNEYLWLYHKKRFNKVGSFCMMGLLELLLHL